jgi:segregation and condensation protein A
VDFQIKQEKFEGPLELLVELIEREELSISEVSLAKVADDYIRYMKLLEKIDAEALAEFLVVASQLMLLKSRALVPSLVLPEEEGSIEELEQRLREYQRLKRSALSLAARASKKERIGAREPYQGVEKIFRYSRPLDRNLLQKTFGELLSFFAKPEKLAQESLRRVLSLEERIGHIKAFLEGALTKVFSEIAAKSGDKGEIILSFLAILELAKIRFVELRQEKLFDEIIIKKSLLS